MDSGAHFHCCDLQIHTPRDNNWVGECPVTEEARKSYAVEFISACRQKGLDSVAITDHHDLGFFPYIRAAAQAESDSSGRAVPTSKQIVVFPGLELTLAVPCQALLLFDPSADEADLEWAMAALLITHAGPLAPKGIPVERLVLSDLNEIYERLEERDTLRGRFIVLPNMNDGGGDTLLRGAFFEKYKNMVCVGGYVDGSCSGHGGQRIIDGKVEAWGNKRVGLIQTSDSRNRDFSRLGSHPTWIKWSSPSTEALRQACLAPDSRIRYAPPLVPDSYISRIRVSNSKFFGPFSIEFSPQLNTIIGGRGSGKSTVLEYLRWALCDQAYAHSEEEATELPDFERRRRALILGTLRQFDGIVSVDYIRHGVLHRVRRESITGRVYLRVADQPETETTEDVIQNLAQIQGYSQKQLSHVSVRAQELIRLLRSPISQDLATNKSQIDAAASELRQAFERYEGRRNLLSQLQAIELDLTSKREQLRTLTDEIRDLPAEQRNDIGEHAAFVEGERLAGNYSSSIDSGTSAVVVVRAGLRKLAVDLPAVGASRPEGPLSSLRQAVSATLQ
ncbi:MAG: AAA family ATPase, partial [Candidatus Acidiferrales bacterium]